MQTIRNLTLVMSVLLIAGCSSFTGKNSPTLSRSAQWGVVPLVNYSQTPQAGERSEQILLSVLSSKGLHPRCTRWASRASKPCWTTTSA